VMPWQRVWADKMRHGRVMRVWAPRGVKVRQRVRYLALAVDVRRGVDRVAKAVRFWKGSGIDVVVWDRACSHRSLEVRQVGMVLIGQPTYSPELNPAERIFEDLASQPERVKYLVGWEWIHQEIEVLYQNMAAS